METAGPKTETRILIVDDEPPLLKMMSLYLRRLGYVVTACERTEQALALDRAEIRDLALAVLDASMEGNPLDELAMSMLRENRSMRILAASGYPVDVSTLEAAAPGRVAFLHKPFSPEMLAATVRRMIGAEEEKGI
ncbi:MAG: response regulator [Acidobacteriia bacterium]|nr:response regulator [Terriglobia bacterium]MBV9744360.1 response regulator [Terriglobia bacterium]